MQVETLERPGDVLGLESGAGVAHGDLTRPGADVDRPAGRSQAQRILDQVRHRLKDPVLVALDPTDVRDGQQLTIREETKAATYKTVTLTIPSSAKVRDNGKSASLSQLTQGQRVGVVQGPKRTPVVARTPRP